MLFFTMFQAEVCLKTHLLISFTMFQAEVYLTNSPAISFAMFQAEVCLKAHLRLGCVLWHKFYFFCRLYSICVKNTNLYH